MNPTEPRFEFRVFGQNFGRALEAIMHSSRQEEQDEGKQIYILSSAVMASSTIANPRANPLYSVKIREGKLDSKVLMRTCQGLERWHPHLRLAFPLTSAFLHEFFFAWLEIDPPPLRRDAYTEHQFLQELILPNSWLRAVQLHKQRRYYQVGSCQIEMASLRIEHGHHRQQVNSVAVESTEAGALLRMLNFLELDPCSNTNYMVALSQLPTRETVQRTSSPAPSESSKYTKVVERVLV